METGRKSESLEILMEMPPDNEPSKSESRSSHHPHMPTKMTKSDAKHEKTQVYKKLTTLLWQNEQKMEYKVIIDVFISLCFAAIITASFISQDTNHRLLAFKTAQWILVLGSVFFGLFAIRLWTFIILQYLIVPIFKLHKNVVFFARGLKTSVDTLLWLGLIITFCRICPLGGVPMIDQYNGVPFATGTLEALVLGASFWIMKNMLLLKLESDLHLNRFFDRIRYAVLHLHGIQMIDNKGAWYFGGIEEREEFLENVHVMKKGVPTWVLKSLANLFKKSLKELRLPHVFSEFCDDEVLIDVAGSILMRKVIDNPDDRQTTCPCVGFGTRVMERIASKDANCGCISGDDLKNRVGLTEKEAQVLLSLIQVFATDENSHHQHSENEVEHKTFIMWVTHAYRTCWSLRRCLNNSRAAINQLNKLLTSFLVIVVIVIWLLRTDIATQGALALAFSPFLAATFIFGDSCKTMFQGIIFAFVAHPFEVGDRCVIDDQQMKVIKINILTTELWKYDNGESVVYPNSVLGSKNISNFRDIRNQEDILQFGIDVATQWEAIDGLRSRIQQYLHDNPHLCSEVEVVMKDFGKIAVHFKYLVSHPDSKRKERWKSELLYNIRKILEEYGIKPTS